MDPNETIKELELDILKIIEEKLSSGDMQAEQAQAIAKMVLDKLHPPLTLEQLRAIVPTLDDEFKDLSKALIPFMSGQEDLARDIVTKHAEELIRSGKLDEAIFLLKNATEVNK